MPQKNTTKIKCLIGIILVIELILGVFIIIGKYFEIDALFWIALAVAALTAVVFIPWIACVYCTTKDKEAKIDAIIDEYMD